VEYDAPTKNKEKGAHQRTERKRENNNKTLIYHQTWEEETSGRRMYV